MQHFLIYVFAFILLFVSYTGAQIINLTKNGKSDYRIVVSLTTTTWDSLAVNELQKYLKEISGALLPIVNDTTPIQEKEIVIGSNNRSNAFQTEIPKLEEDGFTIRTINKKLFILGGNRRGTLNGVYAFLEMLGCRKYSAAVSVIPKRKSITIKQINTAQVPFFKYRDVHYLDAYDRNYSLWHKLDADEESRKIWGMFVHTFNKLLPAEKYFKERPEYFSEINGIRVPDGQLCLTNPDVFKIVIENLRDMIKKNPTAKIWSVSQNDNFSNCRCERCKAIDDYEGSPSGSLLTFVNKVAAEFPDKIISTLAYSYTRSAPKYIKPASNVNIVLCSIECNRSKPLESDPNSKSFVDDLREWTRLTNNIMIWDYVVQFRNTMSPFPNFHVLQPNLQLFKRYGAKMMFQQGAGGIKGAEFGSLRTYLIAKLLWNPSINIDSVMIDFLKGYYGAAYKYIYSYIKLMNNELKKSKTDLLIYGNPISPMDGYLSHSLMDRYNNLFDKAWRAVKDTSEFLERVKIARLPLKYAMLEQAKVICESERGITVKDKTGKIVINKKIVDLLSDYVNECNRHDKYLINESGVSVDDYKNIYQEMVSKTMHNPLALNKSVTVLFEASKKYPANGTATLTDGLRGINDYNFNWLGFEAEDLIAVIDLGENYTVKKISADFLQDVNSWVFLPQSVEYLISKDGDNFESVSTIKNTEPEDKWGAFIKTFAAEITPVEGKYLKVIANSMKICPKWHKGYPGKAWIFTDEIVVE